MWIGCPKTPVQYSAAEKEESASKRASANEGSERSRGTNGGSGVGGSDGDEVVDELPHLDPKLDDDDDGGKDDRLGLVFWNVAGMR